MKPGTVVSRGTLRGNESAESPGVMSGSRLLGPDGPYSSRHGSLTHQKFFGESLTRVLGIQSEREALSVFAQNGYRVGSDCPDEHIENERDSPGLVACIPQEVPVGVSNLITVSGTFRSLVHHRCRNVTFEADPHHKWIERAALGQMERCLFQPSCIEIVHIVLSLLARAFAPRFHRMNLYRLSQYAGPHEMGYTELYFCDEDGSLTSDETFDRESRRAKELGMSRSEFFARAAGNYLDEPDPESLTARSGEAPNLIGDPELYRGSTATPSEAARPT